jgi:hypothetical protein
MEGCTIQSTLFFYAQDIKQHFYSLMTGCILLLVYMQTVQHQTAHMIEIDIGHSLAFIGYSQPAFGAIPPQSKMTARYWPIDARAQIHFDQTYEECLFS